jgi:hypothetical protein
LRPGRGKRLVKMPAEEGDYDAAGAGSPAGGRKGKGGGSLLPPDRALDGAVDDRAGDAARATVRVVLGLHATHDVDDLVLVEAAQGLFGEGELLDGLLHGETSVLLSG